MRDPFSQSPFARATRMLRRVVLPYAERTAQRKMIEYGLAPLVTDVPGFAPVPLDLVYLYELVQRRKPRNILEFGSGCSTLVFARALEAIEGGTLISCDTDQGWLDKTRSACPHFIAVRLEWRVTPAELLGDHAVCHAGAPDVPFDLVYVDSPPGGRITLDPLRLPLGAGACIVVDGRERTSTYLRDHVSGRWSYDHHWLRWNATLIRRG